MRIFHLFALLILFSGTELLSLECSEDREQYNALNLPLIVKDKVEARAHTVEREDALTAELHSFVQFRILALLSEKDQTTLPSLRVKDYLACLQDLPQYRNWQALTRLPMAWDLAGKDPTIAVAFWIFRGYPAVPNMRPYLEVFKQTRRGWKAIGEVGSSFSGFKFDVHTIKPGKKGQHWFVLSGARIGDSGGRLRLAIAAFDGKAIREIWSSPELRRTLVNHVSGRQVVLVGERTNQKGRAEEFSETLQVVPNGLRSLGSKITRTY